MTKPWDTKAKGFSEDHLNLSLTAIQPHGVLLMLHPETWQLQNVSANTGDVFGIEPSQLVEQPLSTLLSEAQIMAIRQLLPIASHGSRELELSIDTPMGPLACHGFLHQVFNSIFLELEPRRTEHNIQSSLSTAAQVRDIVTQLSRAESLATLLTILVDELQRFTGYHRVMVYQFDHQGGGEVIAEARAEQLPSYLGLHFPAHDIPELSREMYACGRLRVMPDIAAPPVALFLSEPVPKESGFSLLRSPSPCCAEYYDNMGVNASLVVSLLKDGQLWGLISCHHQTTKFLSYGMRTGCDTIALMAAAELGNRIRQDELQQQTQLTALNSELIADISRATNFLEALTHPEDRLLGLVNAPGLAIVLGDELRLVGVTPSPEDIGQLLQWSDQEIDQTLFHTDCLSSIYPAGERFLDTGSGLLRLQLSQMPRYQLLWFRPEVVQMVTWAGNPGDSFTQDEQGNPRLTPRHSFEQWKQVVHGKSLPWQSFELNAVLDLRNAIVGIVLRKADELAQLNRELEHRNRELSSFAYAAAHDLKEPIRGIYNYANVLIEDYANVLDDDGNEYLRDMQGFAQHMEALLNGLLRIAQLRQAELHIESVNLNRVVENVVGVLRASQPETQFDVRVPRELPNVDCDAVLIDEVFSNLMRNAIKYNDKPEKWVEVGYNEQGSELDPVFYVRDNGIGIKEKHRPVIFKLFKRLHPQEFYGGGAGVGLAVAHQIIERHHGSIVVESTLGEGSTFLFNLKAMAGSINT